MSTWKPIATIITAMILIVLATAYGTDARTGIPTGLGWGLFGIAAAGVLWVFRDV